MKYTIQIEQAFAVENDLTLVEAATLSSVVNLPLFAKSYEIDGTVYYWYTHNKIMEDFPLFFKCEDRVRKNIKLLEEKGFLILSKIGNKKVLAFTDKMCQYGLNAPKTAENAPKTAEIPPKTATYNNIIYNTTNDNKEPGNVPGLFPEQEQPQKLRGTTEAKKCLFTNSRFFNFEDFVKCFDKPEFERIDIAYYYHSVADWSASKGRMQKDWIAQTRNFIRGDIERNKVHLKPEYQQGTSKVNVADAMAFLNGDSQY